MSKISAIIVAAGSGSRMGGHVKKQFLHIHGKPVLWHTLERFQNCAEIDEIVIVAPESECNELYEIVQHDWKISKMINVVPGGSERFASVWNGLNAVSDDAEYIVVHDGVRPCVCIEKISLVVKQAEKHGAAILAVKPKDTIKKVHGDFVDCTLDRDELVQVQTPQVFRRDIIEMAYRHAIKERVFGTDDASIVEFNNEPVFIVPGDYSNIKITSPEDLVIAEQYLEMT